jgi:RNA polymerase sigma-70 factor (ECF subfamily)
MRAEEESPPGPLPSRAGSSALRSLVDRASGADSDAFKELFDRHADPVLRYVRAQLGRSGDVDETVHHIFLSAWRTLPLFEHAREGSFGAWLLKIAVRAANDRFGRSRIRGGASLFELRLASLPEAQRQILLLRFAAGLSVADVAKVMGRSEAAVANRQMRGLGRMRGARALRDEATYFERTWVAHAEGARPAMRSPEMVELVAVAESVRALGDPQALEDVERLWNALLPQLDRPAVVRIDTRR